MRVIRVILIGILFIFLPIVANTTIINIPDEQPTIQSGINASVNGDTVLVQPGTYVENINYNGKNIVVGSLFLTTQDTSYISQTIIDGNHNGTVVTFDSGEDTTAVLAGFTITNGYTNGIWPNSGGGICCSHSSPNLENVTIIGNSATGEYSKGGGIYCWDSSSNLENVTITGNSASDGGGGICCVYSSLIFSTTNRCNIYSNTIENMRGCGADIFTLYCNPIDVIVDTFTVLTPTDYYASPIDNFTFDILHSVQGNLLNSDVYVSVDGDDSNTGTSADDPFRTIKHALSVIYSDSLNINTIHLTLGVYSDSTNGETFPIIWSNYVNLHGSGEYETILDAHHTSGVLEFYNVSVSLIEEITIRNGNSYYGGGIYCCDNSFPSFENVTITGNSAGSEGGGIFCWYNSSPSFEDVTITDNSANLGGGIFCWHNSFPSFENVTINNNSADYYGGGIYCCDNSSPSLDNVTITGNIAVYEGGGIYCSSSSPSLVNSILWNDSPQEVYFDQYGEPNTITISYSDIEGGETGIVTNNNGTVNWLDGNIDADPLFVDPVNGDYHLSWTNFPIPDSTMSPCIDAGDPNSPPDPDGTIADMGAYYFDQTIVAIDNNPDNVVSSGLFQNYPNPFSTSTIISFNLATSLRQGYAGQAENTENTEISIYNLKGQLVKQFSIVNSKSSIEWDGKDEKGNIVNSGIYFYQLEIGNKIIATKK